MTTYPNHCVQLRHGDLLGAFHGGADLLLVLGLEERYDLTDYGIEAFRDLRLEINKKKNKVRKSNLYLNKSFFQIIEYRHVSTCMLICPNTEFLKPILNESSKHIVSKLITTHILHSHIAMN